MHIYGSTSYRDSSFIIETGQAGIILDSTMGGAGTKKYNIWSTTDGDSVGQGSFVIYDLTSGFYRFTIKSNGDVVIGGNVNVGSLTNPSDSRIKKDIEDINDDTALNKLLLIQPTTYNYIEEERNKGFGKVYGFIAQQIKEVIPEAVTIINTITPIPNIYKSCLI
ncbi:tail fiber domain-containing protein, partial [bacterium]|nr:tail fiber domain-containing protein [Candidatus Elulimicrobium humile]